VLPDAQFLRAEFAISKKCFGADFGEIGLRLNTDTTQKTIA